MPARYEAVRVGQDPVVLKRSADRPAFLAEDPDGVVAHEVAVLRDYFELQRHDNGILQRIQRPSCYLVHIKQDWHVQAQTLDL